ncbi:aromatic ring-hydroxylating oxygenase subunit alpha [Ilumatobacter nonamiensis]|uniref:aromatic ring-hydroxylating oxygenase subunit alpha n=1 Tax=Ilumatobacter nonamiensis TaxID=467093 RepID=UPI0011D29D79|nr:aromatic ring-hydroxylating dioxygenase subunit alpha [Ilumatobacter nonamiensis]
MRWTDESAWDGTRQPLRSATGLDPSAYSSPEFFTLEQERVFERAWVCVGVADELAGPGRLLVRRVGSRSILLTRNRDGELRGFINSCRHRGTELADADCEVANTIRCPYHRWGYSLDGALKATPFFDDIAPDGFDRADFGLVPVRVDTWGVLLFACLSDDTPPLDVWLGDLPRRMGGYDLDSWVSRHEQTLEIAANWKLITENFQEYYHLTWVHPELAKVSRVADHYRYQGAGMYCGQTTTPVSGDERDDWLALPEAPGLDASDATSGRFVAIFPNVILSVLPNHVWLMRLEPVAPGITRETCTMLLPAATGAVTDEAIAPTREFWLHVNAEDVAIVERCQRGLVNGAVPPGPLAPRFEEPLHRFHNMLADCMTADDLALLVVPRGDDPSEPADRWGAGTNPAPPTIDLDTLVTGP